MDGWIDWLIAWLIVIDWLIDWLIDCDILHNLSADILSVLRI